MDTVQQRWEVARGLIEHEDELTNQRMSWLLTLQGLLFTSLTVGAGILASGGDGRYHGPALLFLLAVILAGAGSPLLILRPLEGARGQIHAVFYWWETYGRRPDEEWGQLPGHCRYPPIIGSVHGEYEYERYGIPAGATAPSVPWRSYWHLPRYLTAVWVLVLGVWAWMVAQYGSGGG